MFLSHSLVFRNTIGYAKNILLLSKCLSHNPGHVTIDNMENGLDNFAIQCSIFSLQKLVLNYLPKKSSLTSAWSCAEQVVKLPFFEKNAFFGKKKAFFQKVHFIQKCSVTQNTVFQCVKNIFFLSQKKLVFFTEFNLTMPIGTTLASTFNFTLKLLTSSVLTKPRQLFTCSLNSWYTVIRTIDRSKSKFKI